METTQLYIELIIIGLEASIWMCIFFVNIVGNKVLSIYSDVLDNLSSSLVLIGILYIVGIMTDRLSDIFFQKIENKIRLKSGLQAKTSILIWKKYNQEKFSDYTRSRIRVLRASILNVPLISVSLIWYVLKYFNKKLFVIIYIFLLGFLFTYVSWKSFVKLVSNYYNKARVLELNDESQ